MLADAPTTHLPAVSTPCVAPAYSLEEYQAQAANSALRLTPKELRDPAVQARLRVAQLLRTCPRGQIEVTIAQLAAEYGRSVSTIRRWVEDVKGWQRRSRQPTVSLLDTTLPVPDTRAFTAAVAARGIQIYAANPRRGMLAAYNDLCQEAQAGGQRVGSYASYTRLLGRVDPQIYAFHRLGPTGFELTTAPKIVRAWLSTPVYSVLCGDQNIPDYEIVDPSTGEIYTPELYLWMDCTSRAWVGMWPAYGHYNRYTVGYSLREACRLGNPAEIFTDWGRPELSKHLDSIRAGLNGHVACGDWSDYAIRHAATDDLEHRKTTRVGIPWQKPIEAQMNVLKRGLLDLDLPGFRQRQHGEWENDTAMARLAKERKGGRLMETEQFWEAVLQVARRHNRQACRVKETPTPIVPDEVLARGLREAQRHVFDARTLDLVFLPRVTRHVHQSTVRVMVAPGDLRVFHAPELSRVGKGERVQVCWDPFDRERDAILTTLDGEYFCNAEPWNVQQPGDRVGLAHKIKRQMELMRWWRQQVQNLCEPAAKQAPSLPRIGAATQVARAAEASYQAKPDKGAAKRADDALIAMYGGGQ